MPFITTFYGIIITMYYNDHNPPHFHARYGEHKALFNFNGEVIEGNFPKKQSKLVDAWIEIHREELTANWELCRNEIPPVKIDPLR